jgi:hypothetical protein
VTDPSTTTVALPAGAVALPPDKAHPAGNWVVLRDYHDLSGKDVKQILSAVTTGMSGGTALMEMRQAAVEVLVENWSFENLPLPATNAVTDRLPGLVLGKLLMLVEPARQMACGLGVAPVLTEAALEDEASPTTGSSES